MAGNKAGIKEVAKKSGVSISTVSYVLSGKRSVSKETKAKVLKAARELQYSPNAGARMLRGDKTHILALSSPMYETTDYGNYTEFFLQTVKRARTYSYDVLLLAGDNEDTELERIVESGLVDGVVLLDVNLGDSRVDLARHSDVPFVSIGDPGDTEAINAIDTDFTKMGQRAVDTLAELGHTDILFIGGREVDYERQSNFHVRLRDAIEEQAVVRELTLTMEFQPSDDMVGMAALIDRCFERDPNITAIITHSSMLQLGNMTTAVVRSGRSIPDDVSIISVGMGGDAAMLSTPVDQMPLQPDVVCKRGVDVVMDVLAGKRARGGSLELAAPVYIKRGSVARAK